MFINLFRSRPQGLTPNSNAYDLLADAVKHLQWEDDDVNANLLYPSFTDRENCDIVSKDDLRCMDAIISKNHKVLELIEQSISRAVCIVPLTIGRDRSEPGVREKLNILAHISRLYHVCYIQARSFIYKRRWKDAMNAIYRLFQFGDMLGGSWQDFLVETDGEFAKRFAFSAMVEMALQHDVDQDVVRELLRFVENQTPFAKIFLDCRWESFWHITLSFLDHLGEQTDACMVVDSVLKDAAVREELSVLKFCHFDFDKIIENSPEYTPQPQPKYPAATWQDEEDLKGVWPSTAARWISDQCSVSFNKSETISLLEQAFSTILEESAKEPYEFRRYLDLVDSRSLSTYRLTAILPRQRRNRYFKSNN